MIRIELFLVMVRKVFFLGNWCRSVENKCCVLNLSGIFILVFLRLGKYYKIELKNWRNLGIRRMFRVMKFGDCEYLVIGVIFLLIFYFNKV